MLRIGVIHDDRAEWQEHCVEHLRRLESVETVPLRPHVGVARARVDQDPRRDNRRVDCDLVLDLTGAGSPWLNDRTPRYGVWSFHHGDGRGYARGPVTRWEPHCARPTLHVALVRARGGRAPDDILQEGGFATRRAAWRGSLDTILATVAEWPAKVCREAWLLGDDLASRGREVAWLSGSPSPRTAGSAVARWPSAAWRWAIRHRNRWRCDAWAIGIVEAPIHAFLDPSLQPRVTWLPEDGPGQYLADPFGWPAPGGRTIIAERYDDGRRLGSLCAVEAEPGGRAERRAILPLPVHVSYPYLFTVDGAVYCVPETGLAGGAHLFQAETGPLEWRFVTTLIADFAALDSTIIRHEGRFWLFCGRLEDPPHTNLYLWFADELAGRWRPHPRNPVKCDVRSARPAGTPFEHAGALYRPGQDCSETYGGAVTIHRVVRLTSRDFEEEPVASVRPQPDWPYPAGLHTLSAFGGRTLIDAKRFRWRWPWGERGQARHPAAATFPKVLERLRSADRQDELADQTPNSAARTRS